MSSNAPRLRGLLVALAVALTPASAGARTSQDIQSSSGIFISRPKNPPVRRRTRKEPSPPAPPRAQPREPGGLPAAPKPPVADERKRPEARQDADDSKNADASKGANDSAVNDLSDEVEDAIALGNSLRDANPPRYEDAERAYRLAMKLDPRDPRPRIGLANIYYDQKLIEKAVEEYRVGLGLQASRPFTDLTAVVESSPADKAGGAPAAALKQSQAGKTGQEKLPPPPKEPKSIPKPPRDGRRADRDDDRPGHRDRPDNRRDSPPPLLLRGAQTRYVHSESERQWRFYLASALLQLGQLDEAEAQLKTIRPPEAGDASWHATVGFYMAARGRFEEAAALVEKAASLAPEVADYGELLRTIRARQAEDAPRSAAMTKALGGSEWNMINPFESGACVLADGGKLRCHQKSKAGVLFKKGRWRAEGGALHLYDETYESLAIHCVGAVKGGRVDFACGYRNDLFGSWDMSWSKQ